MSKNKKDAAAFLGISTRQIENYARAGRLSIRKEKGKTGDISVYEDEELRQLKRELDAKRGVIQGAVMREPTAIGEVGPRANSDSPESSEMIRAFASQLSRLTPQEFIAQLAAAILTGRARTKPAEAKETQARPQRDAHQRPCCEASFDESRSPTLHRLEQEAITRSRHVG